MTTRVLFVGESPPPGAAPDFAPFDCASGTRLATLMLGLKDRATMLEQIPRANIYDRPTGVKGCDTAWEPAAARALGKRLLQHPHYRDATTVIALGRRTAEALGMPDPVRVPSYNWAPPLCTSWGWSDGGGQGDGVTIMYAPHPSGRSSVLTDPTVLAEVRAMLLPELILGVPSLRPWHFRLDDPSTLAALAAAVSPLCPALGAAALLHADGMHRARSAQVASPLLVRISAAAGVQLPTAAYFDEPLALTTAILLQHDGGRRLSGRWDLPATLVKTAKDQAALNTAPSRSAMRATLLRYAAAGLA